MRQGQDVSFADTALSVAKNVRNKPFSNGGEWSSTRSIVDPGRLLANGSAADLDTFRNGVADPVPLGQYQADNKFSCIGDFPSNRKRKQANISIDAEQQYRCKSGEQSARPVSSRDVMPPPQSRRRLGREQNISPGKDGQFRPIMHAKDPYNDHYNHTAEVPAVAPYGNDHFNKPPPHVQQSLSNAPEVDFQSLLSKYESSYGPSECRTPAEISTVRGKSRYFGYPSSSDRAAYQGRPRKELGQFRERSYLPSVPQNLTRNGSSIFINESDEQMPLIREPQPHQQARISPYRLTLPMRTPSVTVQGTPRFSAAKNTAAVADWTYPATTTTTNRRSHRQQLGSSSSRTVHASPYFRNAKPSYNFPTLRHGPFDSSRSSSIGHAANSPTHYHQPIARKHQNLPPEISRALSSSMPRHQPPSITHPPMHKFPTQTSKMPIISGGVRGLYPNSIPRRRPANR